MFVTEVPHKCVSTGSARKLCQLLGMFWQIVRSLAELRTFVFVFSTASSGAIPQWQHKWLSDSIKIGYPRLLQWPWTYLMYTSSKTDGFLGTHRTSLTRFLIFQWKLLSSATYLRVIKGTFNHLLGTEITRVILSRNRVGTENRVLWKVGFKLIPKFNTNETRRLKSKIHRWSFF